jgi:hypothetical protein
MLNLSQSATLPTIALHHRSTESVFNISNRAPPIISDTDDKRSDLRALLARIGCGQVWIRRGCRTRNTLWGCKAADKSRGRTNSYRLYIMAGDFLQGRNHHACKTDSECVARWDERTHPARSRRSPGAFPSDAAMLVWTHSRGNSARSRIGARTQFA